MAIKIQKYDFRSGADQRNHQSSPTLALHEKHLKISTLTNINKVSGSDTCDCKGVQQRMPDWDINECLRLWRPNYKSLFRYSKHFFKNKYPVQMINKQFSVTSNLASSSTPIRRQTSTSMYPCQHWAAKDTCILSGHYRTCIGVRLWSIFSHTIFIRSVHISLNRWLSC